MPVSSRLLIIGTSLAMVANTFAADNPDSGRLLRESAPPPMLKPQEQAPKIVPPLQPKEVPSRGVRVTVTGFTFTGNTVFTNEELSAILADYLGRELTLAELNAAAAEITKAYQARGFFLASAFVPPQTIKTDAPVVIQIIEGVLEKVRLDTKPAETRTPYTLFQRYVDRVPTGKPADEKTISDMVMRINELPGITSRILIEPGTQQGAAKAVLEVTEGKPCSISLDTDNYGSYSTGYYRIGSTLELYSPLHRGDLFTVRAQTSLSGDTQTVQAGYTLPVSGSGAKVGFNYSFVTYQLGGSFKPLNASGNAHDLSLTISQPVIRSRNMILNLSVGGEGRMLDDRTGSTGLINQRHTAAGQAGISGVQMDTLLGGGSTAFSINYSGGFVGIDDQTMLTNDQSATGMHTDGGYNKVAMSLSRNQNLYKSLSLYTGANGQWASANLDSSEQFSLGGPSAVRAFSVSELSCDSGLVYTAELRYLIGSLGPLPGSLQFAGFFDYGHAVLHVDPITPDNTRDLSGAGLGVGWSDADSFSVRTSVAWRIAGTAIGQSEMTYPTVYFQMVKRF